MVDVFDHPWLSGLFGDADMAALWSAEAQLGHMLAFEAAWSRAGGSAGLWTEMAGNAAAEAIAAAGIDPGALALGTGRDGVCVPALIGRLRDIAGTEAVHKGATSQDVIDTAMALAATASLDVLLQRLGHLDEALDALNTRFGEVPIMGRTRMQAAVPVRAADRIAAWQTPLHDHRARLTALRPRLARVQIGGAAGNRDGIPAAMCAAVAEALDLGLPDKSWHAMRDGVAEFASDLSLISGTLGKMGQDICLMAQQGIDEVGLTGGGGSSAMPHKQNPVLAELLVTLARFNAVQVSGMHQALVHEQERSGAAWSLEWMILPQMVMATGRSLSAAKQLVASITRIGAAA